MSENGFGSNGSTPTPEQFRRRRIVAGAIAALVLLLLIWGMVSLVGAIRGTGQDTTAATTATASATSAPFSDFSERPEASDSASADSASAEATDTASAEASDSAAAEPSDTAEATETAAAEATETAEPTAEATETATAEATDAAATPEPTESTEAAVVACSAADLNVAVTTDQTSYAAGANPAIAVTYTNTAGNPCTIGGDVQSIDINITSGSAQVYNSSMCQTDAQAESELAAGATGTEVMTWNRKLNSLGCGNLIDIQPGYYWATATVNGVTSTPARIIITG